jgi:hypothetical protein
MESLPVGYFCPKCTAAATHDMVGKLRKEGMPTLLIVSMALNILSEAHCPEEIMGNLCRWAEGYRIGANAHLPHLTEEEVDKLKLLAWKISAQGGRE